MNEKKETVKQNVEALCEMFGEDDAVLIVAHTSKPSVCLSAMKGAGLNLATTLAFAMTENPDLLRLAKIAVGFVEHNARNEKD